MIKTFRGQITPGKEELIRLSTNNGLTGYTFKKFQIISTTPGQLNAELIAQVFTRSTTPSTTVSFDNPTLMAVAYSRETTGSLANFFPDSTIIFEATIVNQDLFINITDAGGGTTACNWYIELEQIKLDLNEATVATLKDMRAT